MNRAIERNDTDNRRVHDVTSAYDERVRDAAAVQTELADWVYRMNKSLSEQARLHQAGVLNKRVLNIGCFLPRDEMIYLPYMKQWISLLCNPAFFISAGYRVGSVATRRLGPS